MAFRLVSRRCLASIKRYYTTKDVQEYFHYTKAIVGSLNNSFSDHSLRMEEANREVVDIAKAKKDHDEYVNSLRNLLGNNIVQLPPNDAYPDQVFVEDSAVVFDGKSLLTKVRMPSRKGEKTATKQALESIGLPLYEMKDPNAFLDGGDVIFTGREFLIGLSSRTNKEGIEEFARYFSDWPVTGITVAEGTGVLHLKSMSSLCGIDTIAIGDSTAGRQAWKDIESKAKFKYKRLVFPDNNGANCLFVNGVVLYPSKEDYPESYEVWKSLECEKVPLRNSELSKSDGSLTCCSILIN